MMRRNLTITATIAWLTVGAACSKGPSIPVPSIPPVASATSSTDTTASGLPTPSASPAIAGFMHKGTASLALSGGVTGTVAFATLSTPAQWAPPPGSIALVWDGAHGQTFGLSGASFSGQATSSSTLVVSFAVRQSGTLVSFRSTAGQCIITINQADTNAVSGLIQCTGVPSADGPVTANAQGTFTATG
jgi:hypothetical protein